MRLWFGVDISQCHLFFTRCPTKIFARLPNSNIYLKLHSILTLLFKYLRLLEFIFAVILYIESAKFLSSHFIQHYFRSKYSLQVSFNFQKASFVQAVHLNNISELFSFFVVMHTASRTSIQQRSLISQMFLICLHLIQRLLVAKFFVGLFMGIISTVIVYNLKEPIEKPRFRPDQSKFEYEKNQQTFDDSNPSKPSIWNSSWDGFKSENKFPRHFYLIRHGQYFDNARTMEEMKLTLLGKEQLEYTGKRLNQTKTHFDRLIHSGMVRAFESAVIINQQFDSKLDLIEDKSLSEGLPVAPIPYAGINQRDIETYGDRARIDGAFAKYFHRARSDQNKETHDIIVFHANILRYFICKIMQFPVEAWLRITLNHGSITQITILSDGGIVLKTIGDSGFIPANKVTF
ncbi:unnamed protein product [Rotaria socialis]|uniref:Serine/threonine-protein phosphatase PGAM5, mitochondrial n=1 Tax=Rotaria socialis TaxID=392032 RepID=A0A818ACU2_9BILA|nr:unnamed protein product [Rotaria socialis]CAF3405514.1 unnamed protein product [Rotaria socialis]